MFEQSMLLDKRRNKWTMLASVSGELAVVGLLIVIPLIYGDHLPDFHWRQVVVGPAIRSLPRQPVQRADSNSPARIAPPTAHLVFRRVHEDFNAVAGPATLELPPGIELSNDAPGGGGGTPNGLFTPAIQISEPPNRVRATTPPAPTGPVRISGGVQMAKLIKQVIPVYPVLAKNARIS